MLEINSHNLRTLREQKNLTLDELAIKAGIDRGTISRIENGRRATPRPSTVRKLASALGVETDVLMGYDVDHSDQTPIFCPKTQMNFKMANDARNALKLTAIRYNVKASDILHLAPLLFYWAAEMSLKWRQERIDTISKKLDDLANSNQPRHLSGLPTDNWRGREVIEEEQRSIDSRDLFGLQISADSIASKYEESEQNPMALFLSSIASSLGDQVRFEYWSPEWSHPGYTLGLKEALELVGGDVEAALQIVNGYAPLHEMPKDIKEKGADAIANWASEVGAKSFSDLIDFDSWSGK